MWVWLNFERDVIPLARDAGKGALAQFVKRGLEQNLLHGHLHVLPQLLQTAGILFGAGMVALQVDFHATRSREFPVDCPQDFANRNLVGTSSQRVPASNAAM